MSDAQNNVSDAREESLVAPGNGLAYSCLLALTATAGRDFIDTQSQGSGPRGANPPITIPKTKAESALGPLWRRDTEILSEDLWMSWDGQVPSKIVPSVGTVFKFPSQSRSSRSRMEEQIILRAASQASLQQAIESPMKCLDRKHGEDCTRRAIRRGEGTLRARRRPRRADGCAAGRGPRARVCERSAARA